LAELGSRGIAARQDGVEEVGHPVREFLAMGGYAAYVWSAFGLTLAVLLGLLWQSWRLARRRDAELAELRERLRGRGARPARRLTPRRQAGVGEPV
jgi:heme exporter protein D